MAATEQQQGSDIAATRQRHGNDMAAIGQRHSSAMAVASPQYGQRHDVATAGRTMWPRFQNIWWASNGRPPTGYPINDSVAQLLCKDDARKPRRTQAIARGPELGSGGPGQAYIAGAYSEVCSGFSRL